LDGWYGKCGMIEILSFDYFCLLLESLSKVVGLELTFFFVKNKGIHCVFVLMKWFLICGYLFSGSYCCQLEFDVAAVL
jgi:hypothetical protein